MLDSLIANPLEGLAYLVGIVLAVTIHEYAHAWSAVRAGDDTPRLMGRLSLNPASHLDPLGSIMFLLVGFGWGRPVVYNPLRLRRRLDELLIALSGPGINLLAALILRLLIIGLVAAGLAGSAAGLSFLRYLEIAATVNVYLAAFNLLPIPPLDGSSILAYFWPAYRNVMASQLGLIILLLLLLPWSGGNLLGTVLTPLVSFFQNITLG